MWQLIPNGTAIVAELSTDGRMVTGTVLQSRMRRHRTTKRLVRWYNVRTTAGLKWLSANKVMVRSKIKKTKQPTATTPKPRKHVRSRGLDID